VAFFCQNFRLDSKFAIARILADTELFTRFERNANQTARAFAPEIFLNAIFALADDCAREESGSCPSGYDDARKKA
jgi:hypothetical protein